MLLHQPIAGAILASHTSARHVIGGHGEDAGMDPHDSFTELNQKLREGDQGAATEVFRPFRRPARLPWHARSSTPALRRKEDPEDVVQSVYRELLHPLTAPASVTSHNWDELWGLLAVITIRKCLARYRPLPGPCRTVAGRGRHRTLGRCREWLECGGSIASPRRSKRRSSSKQWNKSWAGSKPDDRADH